jgi:hypothetical protein
MPGLFTFKNNFLLSKSGKASFKQISCFAKAVWYFLKDNKNIDMKQQF